MERQQRSRADGFFALTRRTDRATAEGACARSDIRREGRLGSATGALAGQLLMRGLFLLEALQFGEKVKLGNRSGCTGDLIQRAAVRALERLRAGVEREIRPSLAAFELYRRR